MTYFFDDECDYVFYVLRILQPTDIARFEFNISN